RSVWRRLRSLPARLWRLTPPLRYVAAVLAVAGVFSTDLAEERLQRLPNRPHYSAEQLALMPVPTLPSRLLPTVDEAKGQFVGEDWIPGEEPESEAKAAEVRSAPEPDVASKEAEPAKKPDSEPILAATPVAPAPEKMRVIEVPGWKITVIAGPG